MPYATALLSGALAALAGFAALLCQTAYSRSVRRGRSARWGRGTVAPARGAMCGSRPAGGLVLGLAALAGCGGGQRPVAAVPHPSQAELAVAERYFPTGPARAPSPRFRLLSREQYANTLRELLGPTVDLDKLTREFDAEPLVDDYTTFAKHGVVDERRAEQYANAAEQLAVGFVHEATRARPCEDDTCAARLYVGLAERLYRRPLLSDERARLDRFYGEVKREEGNSAALTLLVEALFRSPAFLFRSEVGAGSTAAGELSNHEIASALAYTFTHHPPDATLLALAREGKLKDPAVRARQMERLLTSPAGRSVFFQFIAEWLGVAHVDGAEKSDKLFKGWGGKVARAMKAETRRFVEHTLVEAGGSLQTLLAAPHGFPAPALRPLYGLPELATTDAHTIPAQPVALPAGERAGILTQASFLTAHATKNETSLTERGVLVSARVLCDRPPPPPPNVPPLPQADGTFKTKRQRLEKHATDPVCASCHESFDPLGYALESYDAVGRFRREENGSPIDPSGEVILVGDGIKPFRNAVELAGILANAPQVHQCFVRQAFRFYQGRTETSDDHPALRASLVALRTSKLDMRRALAALVAHPSYVQRRPAPVVQEVSAHAP